MLSIIGKYILTPYNFCLSPLVDPRLKIERDFTFQSGGKRLFAMRRPPADLISRGFSAGSSLPGGCKLPQRGATPVMAI